RRAIGMYLARASGSDGKSGFRTTLAIPLYRLSVRADRHGRISAYNEYSKLTWELDWIDRQR
ncbi:MAG: hypothetical protein L0H29_08120, partial [Sinobacteraceae bacterium]|nr:hypothetical protein [Nevskiaceae bacterium]